MRIEILKLLMIVVVGIQSIAFFGCSSGKKQREQGGISVSSVNNSSSKGPGSVNTRSGGKTLEKKSGGGRERSSNGTASDFVPIADQVVGTQGLSWHARVKTTRQTGQPVRLLPRTPSSRRSDRGGEDASEESHLGPETFEQNVSYRSDRQGHFSISKMMGEHYGMEAVYDGQYLYQKQRFSRFIPRDASTDVRKALIQDATSYWSTYWSYLEPYATLQRVSGEAGSGQSYKISINSEKLPSNVAQEVDKAVNDLANGTHLDWRKIATLTDLSGIVTVDTKNNITSAALEFKYTLPMPSQLDSKTGMLSGLSKSDNVEISVSYSESTDSERAPVEIVAPRPGTWVNPQRRRTLLEEQFVMGEISSPPDTPLDFKP